MKSLAYAFLLVALPVGAAYADSMNKTTDPKQSSEGTTGALNNVGANGVATDPGGVQAQQGSSAKASPGTVGAAPAADTPSQVPKK